MDLLIKNLGNVNGRDDGNNTALIWAARNGNERTIESILNNKADVNATNNKNETALISAVKNGNFSIRKSETVENMRFKIIKTNI